MIKYQYLIDGIDYTNSCSLPSKEQYVLNRALDNGLLTVNMIQKKDVFKPFTLVSITKDDDTFNMYIASDKVTEIVGTGLYTHNLILIEETKLLEKKIVDTNTTTQPLTKSFSGENTDALIYGTSPSLTPIYYRTSLLQTFYNVDNIVLPSIREWINQSDTFQTYLSWSSSLAQWNGSIKVFSINDLTTPIYQLLVENKNPTSNEWDNTLSLNLEFNKSYRVEYYCQGQYSTGAKTSITDTTDITIYKEITPRIDKSITYVVNRLLAITETLRESETPALIFNEEQAQFYDNIVAPEFSMTKSTLRECLDQIGEYIHSIVRLKGNVIYFDKLGDGNQAELPINYIGNYETLDSEQYASQLDSIVSNLVNIDNEAQGTIIEPFRDAYKTVRAESGTIRIGDGQQGTSAIIETDYPIEKIHKLYCGYIKVGDKDVLVGDITPFVYENAEYQGLSSTGGVYPNSKGFAITYTQGQQNITGLNFKLPNAFSPIFKNQAILNIISQKIGQPIQSIFNVQKITELNFQVIYYPSVTARVKQSRTDVSNYSMELTSIFNQGANKVDSRAYGENLKGTIAMLGNIEKFITYIVNSANDLQNVGDYVIIDNEDYYIATLDLENLSDYIKVTAGLSKNFNALSKYIGIKNNIRLYEVSEKQTVERFVTYDDYCIIGKNQSSDTKQLITSDMVTRHAFQFNGLQNPSYPVSVARLQGYDVDGNKLTQVDLPVFSLGLGNSVWLGCRYKDNYSAGDTSIQGSAAGTSADNYYRVKDYTRYTDLWGELETLNIQMYDYLDSVNNTQKAIDVGNALPNSTLNAVKTPALTTGTDNLVIKKDNRERINLSYQLHFVTNDKYIVGSQMAQGSPLVTNFTTSTAKLYILPKRIGKFTSKIDLTNATMVKDYTGNTTDITFNSNQLMFANEIANANGESWVLIDDATSNLLFGKNLTITSGDTILMPTMTFTHKVI